MADWHAQLAPPFQPPARSTAVRHIPEALLGTGCFVTRAILFDKTPDSNWKVPWHQDVAIAVAARHDEPGFGPWSVKDGVVHVQLPAEVLAGMVTVRVHLDDCAADNGPVRVLPQTHSLGKLSQDQIEHLRGKVTEVACTALDFLRAPEETSARLFPLWSWRSRPNEDGERDVDWYALFPLLWGGWSADARENYFALFPLWADIPEFLTYDRFRTLLFPLFVSVDKGGHRHHLVLWPLIGWSNCAEGEHSWFRVLPFYGHDIEANRFDRRFALWPFLTWSTENEDTEGGAVRSFSLWPLFGIRSGTQVAGWHVLWPLFQYTHKQEHFLTLTLLWPFFRYHWNRVDQNLKQWWLWPFYSRVTSDDQDAWTALWPLIWWRRYDEVDGRTDQHWVLPFFWRIRQDRKDGSGEHHWHAWPLLHHTAAHDVDGRRSRGEWSLLSPLPWRDGLAYGVQEAYGWLWELARGVQRSHDDHAVDVLGRTYTSRSRNDGTTASMPRAHGLCWRRSTIRRRSRGCSGRSG